jgi:hypothetical protein
MGRARSHHLGCVGLLLALGVGLGAIPCPGAAEERATRAVQFAVIPAGGRLTLDGVLVIWFGAVLTLGTGRHDVAIDVPGSSCCEPLRTRIEVVPVSPGARAIPQRFVFRLELRRARVVLVGGPCRAVYSCPEIGLVGAAGRVDEVALPEAQWSGQCSFTSASGGPTRVARVTLLAGELNAVPWPTASR